MRSIGFFLFLVLFGALSVEAAKLPQWAQALADEAPDIGDEISEDFARILLNETFIEVASNGKLKVRHRRAAQVLRTDAQHIGRGYSHFNSRSSIVGSGAWHVPPEGKTKKTKARSALDVNFDSSFLSDSTTRIIPVVGIERGSLVFFEFESEENPWELTYPVLFMEDGPATLMRVAVQLSEGWGVEHTWLSGETAEPVREGELYVWELQDLPTPKSVALARSTRERSPYLLLSFRPPAGREVISESFVNWTDLAAWYEEISDERDLVTPEIDQRASDVWVAPADDIVAGVVQTGIWVRDQVRYVAVELGIGGYRPSPAGEVLGNLYGDCKDKGTLLRSMLSAKGVESYPVLINLTTQGTVSDEIPSINAFDHYVVAVPLAEDVTISEEIASAMVDGGDLGQLLIVDVTDEWTAVGHLSAGVSGKKVLIVAGDQSRLIQLPSDPTGHRVERTMSAEIADDGSMTARITTTLYGAPAARWRSVYRGSAKDYKETTARDLRKLWVGVDLTQLDVTEEAADGAFVEVVEFHIPAPAATTNTYLFEVFPQALDQFRKTTLTRRETPVEYPHPLIVRYNTRITGVPEGWGKPDVEERSGEGWSAHSEIREEDGVIVADFEFELRRLSFAPEEFRDLRRVWSGARKAAQTKIDVSGAGSTQP